MTQDRLLLEAAALFARKGYQGASIREIAGKAGIKESSLYNHFASKQALYDAVLSMYEKRLQETIIKFQEYPIHIRMQKDQASRVTLVLHASVRIAAYFKTEADPLSLKWLIENDPDQKARLSHYFHEEPLRLIESVLKEVSPKTAELKTLALIIYGSIGELLKDKGLVEAEAPLSELLDSIRKLLI